MTHRTWFYSLLYALLASLLIVVPANVGAQRSSSHSTALLTPIATTSAPNPTPDRFEPNDTPVQATMVNVGQRWDKLNFWSEGDLDYFAVMITETQLGITLTVDLYATFGLDPQLRLLDDEGVVVAEGDDGFPNMHRQLAVVFDVPGQYVIEVSNRAATRPEFKTYSLAVAWQQDDLPATPPAPLWDRYEPNNDWSTATALVLDELINGLNFVCPDGDCVDVDLFRVQVKGEQCYRFETSSLAPGIDTNLIVYGPDADEVAPLGGNDDVASGELRSRVDVCIANEEQPFFAYLLVDNVGGITPDPVAGRTYTLAAMLRSVPTPTKEPTATATLTPATPTVVPTSSTVTPTSTSAATATIVTTSTVAAPPTESPTNVAETPTATATSTLTSTPTATTSTATPTSTPTLPTYQQNTPTPTTSPAFADAPAGDVGYVPASPTYTQPTSVTRSFGTTSQSTSSATASDTSSGIIVRALPPNAPALAPVQPLIAVSLTLPTCYDRNQNKACDVDEGIAGLTVYVTDGSGQILGQALTDSSGVAQLMVRTAPTTQLSISVPYFGNSQSLPATNPRAQPVIISTVAALPALLP